MKVVMRGLCLQAIWGVKATLSREAKSLEDRLRQIELDAIGDVGKWAEHRVVQKELARVYHVLGNFDYKAYLRVQHMEGDKPGRTLA